MYNDPSHEFTRPGQVDPDLPSADVCVRCGQSEADHGGNCRVWCALGGDHESTYGACVLAVTRGDASAAVSQLPGDAEPSLRLQVAGHPFCDGLDVVQAVNAAAALSELLGHLAIIGSTAPPAPRQ